MKNKKIEIKLEQSCINCEFNFGDVCAGHGKRTDTNEDTYGMLMEEAIEMFPHGCEDYGISFYSFMEQEQLNGR